MIVVSDGREIMQDGGIKIWRAKDPGRRARGELAASRRRRVTVGTIKNDPASDLREMRQVVVRFGQRRNAVQVEHPTDPWAGPVARVEEKAGYRYVETSEMVRAKAANGVPFVGLIVAGKELERKHGWWYADALVRVIQRPRSGYAPRTVIDLDLALSDDNGQTWTPFVRDRYAPWNPIDAGPFQPAWTPPELGDALRAALDRWEAEHRPDWGDVPDGIYRLAGGRLWPQKGRWE